MNVTHFTLCAHPDVFSPKVRGSGDGHKYIGMPVDRDAIEQKGIKIRLDTDPVSLAPGITTTGEIPFDNDFERVFLNTVGNVMLFQV